MTKTRRHLVAWSVALSVLACSSVEAVTVRGVRSCGVWVKDRDISDKNWLLGFLSGLAFMSDVDILKGVDNESIYLWMDKYCRANPLKDIADGSETLFEELKRTRRPR